MDAEIMTLERKIASYDRKISELQRKKEELSFRLPLSEKALFVIERMGIDRSEFLGQSKRPRLLFARCAVAAFLRAHGFTNMEIACILRRDRSSVWYYLRSYDRAMSEPRFYADLVAFLDEFNKQLTIR